MKYICNDFGGILLQTQNGNIAINCGAEMAALEAAYLANGEPLRGLILTSEHTHRSRNAASFSERHQLPVLGSLLALAQMHWYPRTAGSIQILPVQRAEFCGVRFSFHHLRYDSIDPFYLIAAGEGRKIGFVFDGRLNEKSIQPLLDCDEVFWGNRLDLPAAASALARRSAQHEDGRNASCGYSSNGYKVLQKAKGMVSLADQPRRTTDFCYGGNI